MSNQLSRLVRIVVAVILAGGCGARIPFAAANTCPSAGIPTALTGGSRRRICPCAGIP